MHYKIIVLDSSYNMYIDMVYMLTHFFDTQKNITYSIDKYNSNYINDSENQCIFFGTEYYKYHIPKGSIITEFDCIDVVKNRLNLLLAKNNTIWVYSKLVKNFINRIYPKTATYMFYYGYSKILDYGNQNNKDIDICFIGSLYPERRQKIFNHIRERFKDRNIFIGGYNPYLALEARGEVYKRSKIILSIYSEEKLFDYTYGSRIFPAVSTGGFVIAEKCNDEEQHSILEQICINTEPEKLLDTIEYYLTNETEREDLRKKFYANVKNIVAKIDL